jgi:hypothetical protein
MGPSAQDRRRAAATAMFWCSRAKDFNRQHLHIGFNPDPATVPAASVTRRLPIFRDTKVRCTADDELDAADIPLIKLVSDTAMAAPGSRTPARAAKAKSKQAEPDMPQPSCPSPLHTPLVPHTLLVPSAEQPSKSGLRRAARGASKAQPKQASTRKRKEPQVSQDADKGRSMKRTKQSASSGNLLSKGHPSSSRKGRSASRSPSKKQSSSSSSSRSSHSSSSSTGSSSSDSDSD